MRQRPLFPLVVAAILCVAALLLLWLRPTLGEETPSTATVGTRTVARPGSSGVSPARVPPRPTPPLDTPATLADGSFVVRVKASGAPVSGATVRAWLKGPEDSAGQPSWRHAGEGTTAEDGSLRLPAAPGLYLLSAQAQGYAPARREVARHQGESETVVELSLPASVSLRGRTVAEGRGEPVPLAEVTLRPYTEPGSPSAQAHALPEEVAVATSDEQGRFDFTGLAPGRYELVAEAPGFSRRTLRFVPVPTSGELEVGLWPASTLEGFVLGADGQPALDAEVRVLGGPTDFRTTTGAGGGFSLEVSSGTYWVIARKGGQVGRAPGFIVVGPGETARDVTVRLGATGHLAGTVTRVADAGPVEGAWLVASPTGAGGELGRARTDAAGQYALELPPGDYDVRVLASGHTDASSQGLVVEADRYTVADFRLEGTASVEGTVVDPRGRPLAGVSVRAGLLRGASGEELYTRTDAAGTYLLEGLPVGTVRVRAKQDTSAVWTSRTAQLATGARGRVDFMLSETGLVQGRVTLASGEPLPEPAVVRAMAKEGSGGLMDMGLAETDAEGHYQLELRAGVYQLTAVLPGARYTYYHVDDPAVTVEPGTSVTMDLSLMDERGLRGVVLEPSGAPSPRALVVATQAGDFPLSIPVDADEEGRFSVPPHPQPTALTLQAHNAGRLSAPLPIPEGAGELKLQLRPAATLRGRVVARSGAAPSGFTLRLLEADGSAPVWARDTQRTFPGNEFLLTDAPGQPLKVSVRTTDGRTGEAQVTLSPGLRADVEVPLTGGASSISGRAVWSHSGAPVQGVGLYLDRPPGSSADARTGPDGRFRLKDVTPGAHTVHLLAPEGKPEARSVTVATSEAVDLGDVQVSARKANAGSVGAGFSEDRGWVSVAWLTPEGPAAQGGVRVGDRLLAVDGQVVRNRTEAERRTQGAPGTPVQVTVRREGGAEQTLQLTRAD
ncbi:carboxypeptidase regulatory-like domain-containing protein [Archangium lansingense]|uniref:Carboxypeptidase regulatory-like domain-containing protein n=1 Tax=Archangium lansingense TaxID=2995310 RepID=A0ABT4AKN2_9BACT|nr:carboxypeptidase regulatory-like domain-containing protein [Archangium lansinium]MCY1082253.1 carboxypeptidase regulatory-like domain-containing protein [Archangium lansinium]